MGRPYTEKGSCRDCAYDGMLAKDLMCEVCDEHEGLSDRTLRRRGIRIKGVCQQLHGTLSPDVVARREEANSSAGRRGRRRVAAENAENKRYKPTETIKTSGTKQAPSAQQKKRQALVDLGVNQEDITFSRGGKSRSAKHKAGKATAAAINAVSSALNPNDPTGGRSRGMEKAVEIAPTIPPPAPAARTCRHESCSSCPLYCQPVQETTSPNDPDSNPAHGIVNSANTASAVASTVGSSASSSSEQQDANAQPSTDSRPSRPISDSMQKKIKAVENALGPILLKRLRSLNGRPNKESRPFLASLAEDNHSRAAVEKALGRTISKDEWNETRKHALYPGAFEAVEETEVFRQKVPTRYLERLLVFLEKPGNVQRFAYGHKVANILKDTNLVDLDSVSLCQPLVKLTAEFLVDLDAEALASGRTSVPPDEERCQQTERGTFRRCLLGCCHSGKCNFTPKGSMCKRTVEELVKELTIGEVKQLSGLDDTKVIAGRENFEVMRRLCNDYCKDDGERQRLLEEIDTTETFYQTDYMGHLAREGEHACCCLTCGFSGVDGIECENRHSHKNPCVDCVRGYDVIERLYRLYDEEKSRNVERSKVEEDRMEDDLQHLDECKRNLDVYRSHLARHKSEGDYDSDDVATLDSDTAVIISDFKMKILSCMLRENQKRFFGKRGTSCLGFAVITNSLSDSDMKDVSFVYMVSDDTTQDVQMVMSGKYELYMNHLPPHITKTKFRSDGAACYSASIHFMLQPMWKIWTGIDEVSTKHSPAGGGKDIVDGGFGRMTYVLSRGVNDGFDYHNAETIVANASREGGGLTASTFAEFLPGRSHTFKGKFESHNCPKGVLRCEAQSDGSVKLFQHSGYGDGTTVFPDPTLVCMSVTIDGNEHEVPLLDLFSCPSKNEDTFESVWSVVESFLPPQCPPLHERIIKQGISVCLGRSALASMPPKADKYLPKSNAKQQLTTTLAPPGMGRGNDQTRQAKRLSRAEQKKRKADCCVEDVRVAKKRRGLYLCDERCPVTGRHCRKEFLTEKGLKDHVTSKKHDFPEAMQSRDRLLLAASRPGGALAVGSRSNRMSGSAASRPVIAAPDDSPGLKHAVCYGRFHRPDDKPPYHKPERLKEFLQAQFDIVPPRTATQAHEAMKAARNDQGGALFSYSQRGEVKKYAKNSKEYAEWAGCSMCGLKPCTGCNGQVMSVEDTRTYFSNLAKKRKDDARKDKKPKSKSKPEKKAPKKKRTAAKTSRKTSPGGKRKAAKTRGGASSTKKTARSRQSRRTKL